MMGRFLIYMNQNEMQWDNESFRPTGEPIKDISSKWAPKILDFYKRAIAKERIDFSFTNDQGDLLNSKFKRWLEEFKVTFEGKYTDIIARLGKSARRIAMVLEISNYIEQEEIPDQIVCSDKTFNLILPLIRELKFSSYEALGELIQKENNAKNSDNMIYNFLGKLPDEFTREQAYDMAYELERSPKTANNYLTRLKNEGKIISISHGRYKKVLE